MLYEHIHSVVTSFGYRHGPPPNATLVLDVRASLYNPHHDPALRYLTGYDPAVQDQVLSTPGALDLIAGATDQVLALLADDTEGLRVDLAIGCAGGRHRSVVLANEIAAALIEAGVGVETIHRDIDEPVLHSEG